MWPTWTGYRLSGRRRDWAGLYEAAGAVRSVRTLSYGIKAIADIPLVVYLAAWDLLSKVQRLDE